LEPVYGGATMLGFSRRDRTFNYARLPDAPWRRHKRARPNSDFAHTRTCRTVAMALRFANGAVGSMTGTYDSSYAYQEAHRLEIDGTRGRAVVGDTVRRFCFQEAGSETAEIWQAGYFNDFDREFHRTFDLHLDAVLDAFKRGNPPPIHARFGRRALRLAWAAIESRAPIRSGQSLMCFGFACCSGSRTKAK